MSASGARCLTTAAARLAAGLGLWGCLALLLAACGQSPPSWDVLLAGKISGQYPTYTVTVPAPGRLTVERPGMPPKMVAVDPIAQHCLRLRLCGGTDAAGTA